MINSNNFFCDIPITKIDDFSSSPWLRERLKDDATNPISCVKGSEIDRNSSGSGRSNAGGRSLGDNDNNWYDTSFC